MNEFIMNIEIPADNDGFVLLQCQICGEFFKIIPSDYENDYFLEIFCPNCGLANQNYLTDDVINLSMSIAKNKAVDSVYDVMKKWEQNFKGSLISFKVSDKPTHEYETPIYATIDSLTIVQLQCCRQHVKIKPMLKMCGCYCPFCGVKSFEIE